MVDLVGGFACLLVLLTFSMRDMTTLRLVAIVSNIAFISYAYMADLMPVLALHAILLPINAYALWTNQSAKRNNGCVVRPKKAIQERHHRRTSYRKATRRDAA